MKSSSLLPVGVALTLCLSVGACRCDDTAKRVKPIVSVAPLSLDFGKTKVGGSSAPQTLSISAGSQAALTVTSITLRDGSLPGGAAGFELGAIPTSVSAFSSQEVQVTFKPTALLGYEAILSVNTNDEERPTVEVLLTGEGATPKLLVTPSCEASKQCKGTAAVSPPSIDFGAEPLMRLSPIPTLELPLVAVRNEGDAQLFVTSPGNAATLVIEGRDAAAFKVEGNAQLPGMTPDGHPAIALQPTQEVSFHLRFVPTIAAQLVYDQAELVLRSDDPERPEVRVKLSGTLRPNEPPKVCANIVTVRNSDGSPQVDYDKPAEWAPLLVPPAGGYDFTATRDIQPGRASAQTAVTFSAHSDADVTHCTTDPEDARVMLTYKWEVLEKPAGAGTVSFAQPAIPRPSLLLPPVSGLYKVQLTVSDVQGHATAVTLKFAAVLKQDLVAQLSWSGYAGIDLDLHLVRPSSTDAGVPFSGAFSFFSEPGGSLADGGQAGQTTSGDINGFTKLKLAGQSNFDWGANGTFDDPVLNVDDTGSGSLVENISLNYPENDRACATAECRYKLLVHYFKDTRVPGGAATCTVGGACADGDRCGCAGDAGIRCVADTAPPASAASGGGRCFYAPAPVVRVFVRSNPTPYAIVPLDTLVPPDQVFIGAPCQALYVADVIWPAKSSLDGGVAPDGGTGVRIEVKGESGGRITAPVITRFGQRNTGNLECAGNVTTGGLPWYEQVP